MKGKIAIHARPGSFSDRWIEYCQQKNIPYKTVDCHSSDIIEELGDCSFLMWNWNQTYAEDMLIARGLIKAVESMGIRVFPNSETCWHFDDKVAQKYLMEALGVPMVKSYVFLDRARALEWARKTEYPKVFKLRGGAGSSNVFLVNDISKAKSLINKAFSTGFPPVSRWNALSERWWQFKRDRTFVSFFNISRGIFRALIRNPTLKCLPIQKNYAYFQDFIPNNDFDIRVKVIGERAYGLKRMVREGDFRASGSGKFLYDQGLIPRACIKIAFDLARKIKSQSLALDFVFHEGAPLIVEMSYAFSAHAYLLYSGYWRSDMTWVEGNFHPEDFMVDDLIVSSVERS
ncbi:hypothetical protein ABHF54_11420 [Nitrosomonas europaea]|uniref:ATP-grasp domain-containing protein n=1 Tax=Nitrosomonas europaea TaxID=915 RepID=UPI0032634DA6